MLAKLIGPRTLRAAVQQVVDRDNCSGCGGCTVLSSAVSMQLDAKGFLRPQWEENQSPGTASQVATFRRICPGRGVSAPGVQALPRHPVVGSYMSVWAASAVDSEIRFAGSSGGVLTALSDWLLASGAAHQVRAASPGELDRRRTQVSIVRNRADALAAAGSRYAPVASLVGFDPADSSAVLVAKPCEAYAARGLIAAVTGVGHRRDVDTPVILSFFCAGVPSQLATESLIGQLGIDPEQVTSLRYRGQGWPGSFRAQDASGASAEMSYEDSWGRHLGRQVQSRCKVCPDGVGEHGDIAVGDYWDTDDRGYPIFEAADGMSVAVARTRRGHELLMQAQAAGVLELREVTPDSVAAIQPLQTLRSATLLGRLGGRLLARRPVPRYDGYPLLRGAIADPRATFKAFKGTYRRAMQDAKPS